MKRLASMLILLPLMACLSCNTNNGHATTEEHADTVKTVPFNFHAWSKALKVIEKPIDIYSLEDVTNNPGPFAAGGFKKISAGILSRSKSYMAIIAWCETNEKESGSVTLLLTYTPDGKEIARQEIGREKQETREDESNYLHKWPEMNNDSIVLVKEIWYTVRKGGDDTGENKARMKQYKINQRGEVTVIPQETESFDAFTGRFNVLTTPLNITMPDLAQLKPLSLLTPYFDFSDVLYFNDIRFYHYGKIPLPGKRIYLLYAAAQMYGDEAERDSTVQLIAYTSDGKETGRVRLNGIYASEGLYDASKNAAIAADGTISVTEESNEDQMGDVFYFTSMVSDKVIYRPDAEGKLVRELKAREYNSSDFSTANLKEMLVSRRKDADKPDTELDQPLFTIPQEKNIYVRVHVYDNGQEQLVELYTVDAELHVLDHHVIYNTLKKVSYEKASAKDKTTVEGESDPDPDKKTLLKGPATIRLKDKILQITPEGKFRE
ncbi:hypothetical protein [Chitinophaga flava]|nr:hypothetical protein [Chitinophaga flava]